MLKRLAVLTLGLAFLLGTVGCSGGSSYMPEDAEKDPAPKKPPAADNTKVPPPPGVISLFN